MLQPLKSNPLCIVENPASPISEELLQRLHQATDRFHECRRLLEEAMDGSEYRHQERVDAAEERLRQAEREVEEIDQQIKNQLSSPGK